MPYLKKPEKKKVRKVNVEDRLKVYQSTRWLQLRIAKLQLLPLCEICLKSGRITPATQVHHLDSFTQYEGTDRLYKAYSFDNLLSICELCHGTIHGTHQ